MGRTCPDVDAELFFDVDEIRGAYLLTEAKQSAKNCGDIHSAASDSSR
jgi:hypothetical protein